MEKHHIYFVVTHPIQYFVPLYSILANQPNIKLKVLYLSEDTIRTGYDKQFGIKFTWDIPLLEGYDYVFLPNRTFYKKSSGGILRYFNPSIFRYLISQPPGIVVFSGWNSLSEILGFLIVKCTKHRAAIRCDAPALKEGFKSGWKAKLRKFILGKILFPLFIEKFIYIGKQNYLFYKEFNISDDKLIYSPFSVDNSRFLKEVSASQDATLRHRLGLSEDNFVILFTGKLIGIKRPMDLVYAFQKLPVEGKKLLIVGDGELKQQIEQYVAQEKIENVILAGFINQTDLPNYYHVADVLVLPSSSETWGLSVNEAMAAGLAIIVSDSVGCGDDLVVEGVNGYIYPTGEVDALTDALVHVCEDAKGERRMSKASLKIIQNYTLENTAQGIMRAAGVEGYPR